MKRYVSILMLVLLFCAVVSGGCGGGGSDSPDAEQTESLNEDTGEYDPNEEARGNSGSSGREIDLSTLTANYIAQDGETLTGTLGANVKVSIADGASVTIRDVIISREKNNANKWAGLNCSGDATIILEGTNTLKGVWEDYPGIHVPEGKTLTIKGDGELTASSNGWAAGIGGGFGVSCGNIVIEGGTIEAEGGWRAAGIGGGQSSSCGKITITGGTVTAKKGNFAPYSIGAGGEGGTCEKVTIGGLEVIVSDDSFTYLGGKIIDLSTLTANYTAQNRETLTGTLRANVKISIADGATAALWNVTIKGVNSDRYRWAGINCEGNATIFLEGTNYVEGYHNKYPGIHVLPDKTLTINGNGELTARSCVVNIWDFSYGAGIGGSNHIPCGNIVIEGGVITAIGGDYAAGIGGGRNASCGHITIKGGKITATKGKYCPYSVGPGNGGTGDKEITLCGVNYTADEDTFTYGFEPNTDGTFNVNIDVGGAYNTNSMVFYGRKYLGLNEDGSYKLSGWEKLGEWPTSEENFADDQNFNVSRKYVELGFEFSIQLGPTWAYSNKFRDADLNNRIDKVEIAFGGSWWIATTQIKVNGNQVAEETAYFEHKPQYNW